MESVNAFIGKKETVFNEYSRVLKQGGMLVINEAAWKKLHLSMCENI
jgi:ubiquinone/menaquinone biosynthesis C-methylase UbiE